MGLHWVTAFNLEEPKKREMMRRCPTECARRPRLLLAYADAAYASECGRYFRRLGWEVQMVAGGAEALLLADEYQPDVVVLDAELLDESGWLTSAKINKEHPKLRIILVSDEQNLHERLQAVGAERAVRRADGAEELAHVILGRPTLSEAV